MVCHHPSRRLERKDWDGRYKGVKTMDPGLVNHALESDRDLTEVLDCIIKLAQKRRSGVIPLDYRGLNESVARKLCRSLHRVTDMVATLLDLGAVEKTSQGDGFRVCPDFFPVFDQVYGASRRDRVSLAASPLELRGSTLPGGQRSERSERSTAVAASEKSAQNQNPRPRHPANKFVAIARDVFPALCRQNGITYLPGTDWRPIAGTVKRWGLQYGITVEEAHQMMEEFVRHPEWCQRSRKSPWAVFIQRREQLQYLVTAQQQRDPGSRRFAGQGQEYWIGSRPERPTRGAEYWLTRQ